MVVEDRKKVLSVVLVGDPVECVVSEPTEGLVGWCKDCLVARSAKKRSDASYQLEWDSMQWSTLTSNSNKRAELGEGFGDLKDGRCVSSNDEGSEDNCE